MKEIQPLTSELLRKNSCGSFGQPLLQQLEGKTMGDGVNCATLECKARNLRNDLQLRALICSLNSRMTQSTQLYISGFKRELCPIDVVCGWSMNHFNGRSLAFPPPAQLNLPSAAVFQGREGRGGRGEQIGEKAADGKNWSHLLIVGLTLSGKKTVDPLS